MDSPQASLNPSSLLTYVFSGSLGDISTNLTAKNAANKSCRAAQNRSHALWFWTRTLVRLRCGRRDLNPGSPASPEQSLSIKQAHLWLVYRSNKKLTLYWVYVRYLHSCWRAGNTLRKKLNQNEQLVELRFPKIWTTAFFGSWKPAL